MRRRLAAIPKPILAGLLVFLMAFGIYAATTQQLTGYEPETGAVTEGLVLDGHLWDVEDPAVPSLTADVPGRGGHLYARTGLLQPLLEAPFYAAGHFVDGHFGWHEPLPYRLVFLWFYNPFVAALAAVALFALVFITRRSLGWAAAIAALFVFASVAWPYSKIGMETTFMFAVMASFALAAWARRNPSALSWGLTGLATGAAAASKAYAILAVVPIAVFLWSAFWALDRRQRLRLGLAVALPVLAWLVAIAWYNWYRFGGIAKFGYSTGYELSPSLPLNVLGFFVSPGKGLIFYSPLVVLGALGMPRLWRQDRSLALGLLAMLFTLVLVVGAPTYWSDETWGPRYIVPAAWVLLVPIAWWADSRLRRRVLVGVAAIAVLVQLVGVSTQYARYVEIVDRMTGVPIYQNRYGVDPERIPYGDDPPRWIPQLSALLLQSESLVSAQLISRFGGEGLKVTYDPFEGRSRTVNLSDPSLHPELDFWWNNPFGTTGARFSASLLLLLGLAGGVGLWWISSPPNAPWRGRQDRAPQPA
jgi:hypothetical protein